MYLLAGAWRLVCHRLVFAAFVCIADSCVGCWADGLLGFPGPKPSPMQMEIAAKAGPRADKKENTALRSGNK